MKKVRLITCMLAIMFNQLNAQAQNAGSSLDFDKSKTYVDCGSSTAFEPKQITVEAWIKADSWQTYNWQGTLVSKDSWSGSGGQRGWNLRTGDNGRLTLIVAEGSGGNWSECMSDQLMNTGEWYHVAGTYDGKYQRVYINGSLVKSLANSNGIRYSTNDKMLIGDCVGQIGNRVFDGQIDEVRVWNVALDSTTLKNWMYQPLNNRHPKAANLVAYYQLNEGSGSTAYDSSGNSHNGTLTNFTLTSAWKDSYAPMASMPSFCNSDLAAIWSAKDENYSSNLTISGSISKGDYVVLGHNNGAIAYDTVNKPKFVKNRLQRFWRIEQEGSNSATLLFDYSQLDTSGFDTYRLLVSSDTTFSNATTIGGDKAGHTFIRFKNVSVKDSFYYTLAGYDFQPPYVETRSISNLRVHTARLNGILMDDGGKSATRGICWSKNANPTANLSTSATAGTGTGSFYVDLTNLDSNTRYHYRAFAYNSIDTSYGADSSFTTPLPQAPKVVYSGTLTTYTDSAYIQGKVIDDGYITLRERGFVWSTSAHPDLKTASSVALGKTLGVFKGYATNLKPDSTYYVRAYAINDYDTAYSADSMFTTLPIVVPTVGIEKIHTIKGYTARINANVSFDGRRPVTDKGVVWSTSANPDLSSGNKNSEGAGDGTFVSKIENLSPNTTYHVRAYATNVVGTAYSADSTFLTADKPSVQIDNFSSITYQSATCKSTVTSDGRMPVLERGICYALTANPDINTATVKQAGKGTGSYSINLKKLLRNKKYYVRAYAINEVDTAYSAEKSFITLNILPATVVTKSPDYIYATTALCGGEITSDGGAPIKEKGLVYDTLANPDIKFSTRVISPGTGTSFSSTLSNLNFNTTYHVRAYAINDADTAYGGDSVFTTLGPPSVQIDSLKQAGTKKVNVFANVSSQNGYVVQMKGICWDTKPMPTANLSTSSINGYGTGTFKGQMINLTTGISYYVRAYAINQVDTGYSKQLKITLIELPVVSTGTAKDIKGSAATLEGEVSNTSVVNDKGFAWSTAPNPRLNTADYVRLGTGTGSFSKTISGLLPGTTYYYCAWASNNGGTAYGTDSTFTTASAPTVLTYDPVVKDRSSAVASGIVLKDGGEPVTQRGICYDIKLPDIVSSSFTTEGNGTGQFSSSLSGLQAYTDYQVRAYAINAVDTSYGDVKKFTITPPKINMLEASDLNFTDAKLNAEVNAMDLETTAYFEYGTTTDYGNKIDAQPTPMDGTTFKTVSALLNSLDENTGYHFRLVAENAHGISKGEDKRFMTLLNSISDAENTKDLLKVYAFSNSIILQPQDGSLANVCVYSMAGKLCYQDDYLSEEVSIRLNAGVYLIRMYSNNKLYTMKFLVK